ncbi:beta-ketoacyl synthase N-terminal-like domain-containing protein [Streptomyces sp. NPDC056390]|uniref:thiolase C-terminal domain-containing protein n=1 Tax=Streptomyces sp. NPDC056390 TaxID=3345806 RepID=UPI0035DCB107
MTLTPPGTGRKPLHNGDSVLITRVWVAGVGMTPFGIHEAKSNHDLARWAAREALADAGAAVGDIQIAFYGSATHGPLEGQYSVGGQIAVRGLGMQKIPVYNVENACATGSTAISLAAMAIRAGEADIVLALGSEKMNIGDRERTMAVFNSGYDVSDPDALNRVLEQLGGVVDDSSVGMRSRFMDIYASWTRNHMRLHDTTQEHLAAVASKNHAHSVDNPRAHYRKPMTVEQVLAGRALSYPLTVPMCAPTTDGAAAAVLCSDEGLRKLSSARPVRLLASVIASGSDRDITTFDGHIAARAATLAYERACIGPEDIDVAEVHDATSFGEILQTEMLGLVPAGAGGPAAARGETSLGGRIPVNPSGGLESKGHPIGATGLGQVFELTEQLRGSAGPRQVEGARFAIAENGGGFHRGEEAAASIIILGGR